MHVLVTRPEADAREMRRRLEADGHRVSVAPMLEVQFIDGAPLSLDGVEALIATSRNGVAALARRPDVLAQAKAVPLFAVGPATAAEARVLGFSSVIEGAGSGRELVELIVSHTKPTRGALLHLAGERLAYDLKGALEQQGRTVRAVTVYRTVEAERIDAAIVADIVNGSIEAVTLMSPRTAETFARLARKAGLAPACHRLKFLCLSGAVAAALEPLNPADVRIADSPNGEALFALITRAAEHAD